MYMTRFVGVSISCFLLLLSFSTEVMGRSPTLSHQNSAVYASQRKHTEHFVKGPDGYLHYHYFHAGRWMVDKNTFRVGGRVAGAISAIYHPVRRHAEVVFLGTDGYLRHFYLRRGWQMKRMTFAGKISGVFSALYEPQRRHVGVFAKGADGYLRYLYFYAGRWRVDSRTFRGGGKVTGVISAVYSTKVRHAEVFFRGGDGYLHRYHIIPRRGWQHDSRVFRTGGKVAGEISSLYAQQRRHSEVFFRGADGYLRYYFWYRNRWHLDTRTFRRRGQQVSGSISAVFSAARRHAEVFFRGTDGYVHYFYLQRGWHIDAKSFRRGAKVNGAIAAVYSPTRRHTEFYYQGTNGKRHYFYVQHNWKMYTPGSTKKTAPTTPKSKGKTSLGLAAIQRILDKSLYKRVPILKKILKFHQPTLKISGQDGELSKFDKAVLTSKLDVMIPRIQSPVFRVIPRLKKIAMTVVVTFKGSFEEFQVKAVSRYTWRKPLGIDFLTMSRVGFEVIYNRSNKVFELSFVGTARIGKLSFPGRLMLQVGKKAVDPQEALRQRRIKKKMEARRKRKVKRRRPKKKKKKYPFSNLEISDIAIELPNGIDFSQIPAFRRIPLIRKLSFSNLKLALSEISATIHWKGKCKASGAIVYRGDDKMITMRVGNMSLGGFVPGLPSMIGGLRFPDFMVVIAAKDMLDKTAEDLAPATADLFAGVVEEGDDLPIQSGVNVFGLFSPKMLPARSHLRKALENEFGIQDSLILGGALGGFKKKPTKISFYASLPGFKLPTKILIGGRLRPNPLRKVLSLSRSKLFFRVNNAKVQLGIAAGFILNVPRITGKAFSFNNVDRLKFVGELFVQVEGPKYGIRVAGYVKGRLNNPFGIGNFRVENPAIMVGYGSGNNVTFGIGGTTGIKNAKGRWETFSADFLINVIISKVPIVNKLGFRLKAAKLGPLMGVEIGDRLMRGVLLGPMSDAIENSLKPNMIRNRAIRAALSRIKRDMRRFKSKLRRLDIKKALRLSELPLPLIELRDVDVYFATPGAEIPGRENGLVGMGVGFAGKANATFMGVKYKIGALKHFLTVAEGYILKGHLEPRKLGVRPLQFDLRKAKVDIRANFDTPKFLVHGDIVDALGSRGKLHAELSSKRAKFQALLHVQKVLKLHVNAWTLGSNLFAATDFLFDAHTKETLYEFLQKTLIPKLPFSKDLKKKLLQSSRTIRKHQPIRFNEIRIKGSLRKFVEGKQPATVYIRHEIHGKEAKDIKLQVKPVWDARGKREILMSLFPFAELTKQLIHNYMNNFLGLNPGRPFSGQFLVNKRNNKCLQGGTGHQRYLTLAPCNPRHPGQRWSFNKRGTWELVMSNNARYCGDAENGQTGLRSQLPLHMYRCTKGTNQRWRMSGTDIRSMTGIYCWEASGKRIILGLCNKNNMNQQWSVRKSINKVKEKKIKVTPAKQFKVCLKTKVKKLYVWTKRDGLLPMAKSSNCLDWETFTMSFKNGQRGLLQSGAKIAIRTHHGGYWSAQNLGNLEMNRGKAGGWETFVIYKIAKGNRISFGSPIQQGDMVAIKTWRNTWISAKHGGGGFVNANGGARNDWEIFYLTYK